MKNKRRIAGYCIVFLMNTILFGCVQNPVLWNVSSKQQVIAQYVANNPDKYSEFNKLIESTGLTSLLSVRGPFTLFLPTNEAMQKYYQENNITSADQIDKQTATNLVYNHLINNSISMSNVGLGALRDTNALGDYLVTELPGIDVLINKQSKVTNRDIPLANGYIQEIDHVIDPITINIFDKIASDPSYTLFTEGLRRTGLKDTLQLIKFPFGKRTARTRFTLLAVADTIYHRYGINSIDDLIANYTDRPDSVTYKQNDFYRYMEYHCLAGTFYLSDLTTKLYPILSYDNNVFVTIDKDYKLNYNKTTKLYTGFNVDYSNVPAKNGTIHSIKDLLPVKEPDPITLNIETTDYFDIKIGDWYGKYYKKWYDGSYETGELAKIHWKGDYLEYYYKNHDAPTMVNSDALNMNGYFWCELITPKIMKGHYSLSGDIWSTHIAYEVWVDGVRTKVVGYADPALTTIWGDFIWDKTEEHTIKIVNISYGTMFWDIYRLTPVN